MQDAMKTYGSEQQRRNGVAGVWGSVRSLLIFVGYVSLSSMAWAGESDVAGSAETTIRMYPTAVVSGEEVTLADVAEIKGDSADLIAGWSMTAAPHVGDSGVIELAQLQTMLSRRGMNLSRWVFRGSSRCVVKRVAGGKASPTDTNHHHVTTSQPAVVESANVNPETLEGVMRAHIAKRLASLGGVPLIRFSPAATKLLALSKSHFEFQLNDRGDRLLGMVPVEVTILEQGQIKQTVPILADVSLRQSVVVAVRPINRGETIEANALTNEERIFNKPEDIGATQKQPLVGQRVKRFIDQKEVVFARDIEPVPLVMRNDLVTVEVRRGGFMIRSSAKAISSGSMGESVVLKNEASKETFTAVVTGQKTVAVRDLADGKTLAEALAKESR